MKERTATSSYLDSMVTLLVQHFGSERVQKAVLRAVKGIDGISDSKPLRPGINAGRRGSPSITHILELIRQKDDETYRLLRDFYAEIKEQRVLPESQDIRQFAHIIGLKDISGKSRKEMIPKLMRFLCDLPKERLQIQMEEASKISEQERQQGYSVLTDKLLG